MSKLCKVCGTENPESAKFCKSCGANIFVESRPEDFHVEVETDFVEEPVNPQLEQAPFRQDGFQAFLMDPHEIIICTLGNSYLQNFLATGSIDKAFSVITNKRVYFRGTSFDFNENGKVIFSKVSKAVDIEDVTGVGITYVSLIPFLLSAFFIYLYFSNKRNILGIEYAGGKIGFDVKWFSSKEGEDYQKVLFNTKDKFQ